MVLTKEIIESIKSPNGGYTRAILARLGVMWPPQHGWKRRIIGRTVPDDIFIDDPINTGRLMINTSFNLKSSSGNDVIDLIVKETEKRIKRKERRERVKRRRLEEYSYIVGALKTNLVKIGKTCKPIHERMAGLQTGCPHKLVLLATTNIKEKKLHNRFRHFRIPGTEWFRWNDDLKQLICECDNGECLKKYM